MSAIIAAVINHPRTVLTITCIVLLALGGVALYHAGGRSTAARMQRSVQASQDSADRSMAAANALLVTVKRTNDSLRVANESLRVKRDSLSRIAAERKTTAALIESRMKLTNGDTATIHTDTGDAVYVLPMQVVAQMAAERASMDAAYNAMERSRDAAVAEIAGLGAENDGLRRQITLDSTIAIDYRKQLAIADARIAADEAAPHWTFRQGFVGGALATLAVVTTLAIAF